MKAKQVKKVIITKEDEVFFLMGQPTYPITYRKVKQIVYTNILEEQGTTALTKALLFDFFSGILIAESEIKYQQAADYAKLLEGYDRKEEIARCNENPAWRENLIDRLYYYYTFFPARRASYLMYGDYYVRKITTEHIIPGTIQNKRIFPRVEDALVYLTNRRTHTNDFRVVWERENNEPLMQGIDECIDSLRYERDIKVIK